MTKFAAEFTIAGRAIGPGYPCLVIAEAGVNHFGELDKALRLVDMAVDAGADVFKMQHFKTDRLIGPSAPDWRERMRSKELPDEAVLRIRDYCSGRGIIFMCTGHDEEAFDFLDHVAEVPAFKIGSGEIGNWPWLELIARRGKPMIVSTGMYDMSDVAAALTAVAAGGCSELALLHCVTSYPTEPADANLGALAELSSVFEGPVGYSDHTAGTAVPLAAIALGAKVLEKHITLDRDVPNAQDWKVSCGSENFGRFVADIREIEAALANRPKQPSRAEQVALQWARKSLVAAYDIPAGSVIAPAMLIAQRPGNGMAPHRIGEVVGRRAARDIVAGTAIVPELFT